MRLLLLLASGHWSLASAAGTLFWFPIAACWCLVACLWLLVAAAGQSSPALAWVFLVLEILKDNVPVNIEKYRRAAVFAQASGLV